LNLRNRSHRYAWTLGLLVNIEGRRFLDEGEDFDAYTYARPAMRSSGSLAISLSDFRCETQGGARSQFLHSRHGRGGQYDKDLAENLEINPDVLVETVERYNAAVMNEVPFNPLIHDGKGTKGIYPQKTNWAQKLDTPPYVAYSCTGGLTFTYGGLR